MTGTWGTINKKAIQSRCDPCFFGYHRYCLRMKSGKKAWGEREKATTLCNCPCMNSNDKVERK